MYKKSPLVSIVIPTYNNSSFLEEMIKCIINQTYYNWELIIVDDHSTDNTPDMIKKYVKDERIKYVVRANNFKKGAQTCRNFGKRLSKGKYLCFFDSDDLISNNCIKQRVDYMESHDSLDFAVFPAQVFTEVEGRNLCYRNWWYGNYKYSREQTQKNFLRNFYPYAIWTNIYKRESVNNIEWDDNIHLFQDFDYNLSVLLKGLKFEYALTKVADYYYRQNVSSKSIASNYNTPKKIESTFYLFKKVLDRFASNESARKDFLVYIFFYFTKFANIKTRHQAKEIERFVYIQYGKYSAMCFHIIYLIFKNSKIAYKKKKIFEDLIISIFFLDARYLYCYRNSISKLLKGQRGMEPLDLKK